MFVDCAASNGRSSGEVNWVEIDIGDAAEDADHIISGEERYRMAVALQ